VNKFVCLCNEATVIGVLKIDVYVSGQRTVFIQTESRGDSKALRKAFTKLYLSLRLKPPSRISAAESW